MALFAQPLHVRVASPTFLNTLHLQTAYLLHYTKSEFQ